MKDSTNEECDLTDELNFESKLNIPFFIDYFNIRAKVQLTTTLKILICM